MDAEVRDALETDAESLAAIADVPTDVMRNVVHDRTVRVAERHRDATDPNADADAAEAELLGFVAFDVRDATVHVTQVGGSVEAVEHLLSEPVRFASNEQLDVEFLALSSDTDLHEAAERAGFERVGPGPAFMNEETVRFQIDP
ncbi:hypothetical protein GL213_01060 [Halogeometricum borinquense]|uniref:N-acetyltransferase domain-containing protein n=2 Tax=Halogeometricum borinquense TaxID=60847 RepID=E4NST7_HALBP|nr:hypothetical protein [Halogeometricum borinquense]ADQ65825.1 hypothetical protein Hbor_02140 [Halogeometricum borinquense DSM 11551]ELY26827.1 hypothetical protein C499_11491 [Halogeometricum borinquense DSM 11551]QIB76315.1 hypothetical protein G3I44_19835 [Halogeometricum borinquense]QIQ75249.1 hypothetical protein GL213_01060 [Halogeometricum borinquense]RYJ14904.1 hypothetical protein ELS19_13685 [Halogeometricum borinquense]